MGIKIAVYAGSPQPLAQSFQQQSFDVIIGVDGGAKLLIDSGYQLDFAIGDFDSVTVQQAKQVIVLPAEKDETDLEYALHYVVEHYKLENIDEIIIFGALNGNRLDHTLCNVWLIHDEHLINVLSKIKVVDDNNTMQFLLSGKHCLIKEADKRYLSFINVEPIHHLSLKNVKYPLENVSITRPVAYISNEFLDDEMMVSFEAGKMIVLQTKD